MSVLSSDAIKGYVVVLGRHVSSGGMGGFEVRE